MFFSLNTLSTSNDEKTVIRAALELLAESSGQSIDIEQIIYQLHRGLVAKVRGKNIRISFGNPPFGNKFKRLFNVLKSAENNIYEIREIELDYIDKVFLTFKQP